MKHKYTSTDLTEHQIQACVMEWMKRHKVTLDYWKEAGVWTATSRNRVETADSDEEALSNLAVKLGIPLWNEEAYMKERK